jgi:hypothetical protein
MRMIKAHNILWNCHGWIERCQKPSSSFAYPFSGPGWHPLNGLQLNRLRQFAALINRRDDLIFKIVIIPDCDLGKSRLGERHEESACR